MTPRLAERLARLEVAHGGGGGGGAPLPPELLQVLILVIAVDLGGYPRPREVRQGRDMVGDAFARGLGLTDREALGNMIAVAPARWDAAIDAAIRNLVEQHDPNAAAVLGDVTRTWCWILDRYAALKVRRTDLDWAWIDVDLSRVPMISAPMEPLP